MPPLRYFIPNSFTAASLLLGLASVTMSAQGSYRLAAWMILWGVLLDKVDGSAARLFKATSRFGVEFDSFADFVTFGVAPAALVYFRLLALDPDPGSRGVVMVAAGLYVVALAVRLARFNITTGGESVFLGIPGTLMGAILGAAYLTWEKYGLATELLRYSPACLLIGAGLMVSSIRLPKLKMRRSKVFNAFQVANIVTSYTLGPLMLLPEVLLAQALVYTVAGVIVGALQPDEAPASDSEPAVAGQGSGTA